MIEHRRPAVAMLVVLVTIFAYSLWWAPVVQHQAEWLSPADLWGQFRAAHYVGWGDEGSIYANGTSLNTFPGIAVLLSPVAMVSGALNLTESFQLFLPKPTAWLVLGPASILLSSMLLFPLDAVARRLQVPPRRRSLVMALEAALIWPVVAIWGHPEATLAVAFALYGILAAVDRLWLRAAMLLALGVAFQPLVLVVVPLVLAFVPVRRWLPLAGIVALPSAVLLLAPLAQQWGTTWFQLSRQPGYPARAHPTPWLAWAPVLQHPRSVIVRELRYVRFPDGRHLLTMVPVHETSALVIASGPGRIVAMVIACGLGIWIARWRPPLSTVLWCGAVALSLRCALESVLLPYYLLPGLALALVVAATTSMRRFILVIAMSAACTALSYRHSGPWGYYLPIVITLAAALWAAWPGVGTIEAEPIEAPESIERVR